MSLGVGRDQVEREKASTLQLRALAHPIRLRIMSLLTAAPMTAAEIARELAINHANASYHLRQLHAAGAIVIEGEERIRGGVAKRYRYAPPAELAPTSNPTRPADEQAQRRSFYDAMAVELRRRGQHVRQAGGRGLITDAELWVDPDVWEDVRARVYEASLALHRSAQLPRTPGTIRINATMALFEMESSDVAGRDVMEQDV